MKKALSLFLTMCMFLCVLCSCGTTEKKDENGSSDSGENGDPNQSIVVDPTAKELLVGYRYRRTETNGDQTFTDESITSIEWTKNGGVMTIDDTHSTNMEVFFDEQKRPITIAYAYTGRNGEVVENRMQLEYLSERTVKITYSDDSAYYFIGEYDQDDNLIREETPSRTDIYTYDSHGNCVSKKTDYVDPDQTDEEETTTYIYDADGNAIMETKMDADGKETQTQYSYYPNGNVMMEMILSDKGDVNYHFRPYNPKDLLAWSSGSKSSAIIWGAEYTLEKDTQGRIVEVIATGMDGKQSVETFTYDAQGRLVQNISGSEIITWEYDSHNRLVKCVADTNDTKVETVYTYDDKGRLVKEENVTSSGYRYTEIREYNDVGMVVKMTEESYYPPDKEYPQGRTTTTTSELTYVENSQCPMDSPWADLIRSGLIAINFVG